MYKLHRNVRLLIIIPEEFAKFVIIYQVGKKRDLSQASSFFKVSLKYTMLTFGSVFNFKNNLEIVNLQHNFSFNVNLNLHWIFVLESNV